MSYRDEAPEDHPPVQEMTFPLHKTMYYGFKLFLASDAVKAIGVISCIAYGLFFAGYIMIGGMMVLEGHSFPWPMFGLVNLALIVAVALRKMHLAGHRYLKGGL